MEAPQNFKTIHLDPFRIKVLFFYAHKLKREAFEIWNLSLDSKLSWDPEDEDSAEGSTFISHEDASCIAIYLNPELWGKGNPAHAVGVLAHECCHAARHVMDTCNIQDEETFCYLVEYLMEECMIAARP